MRVLALISMTALLAGCVTPPELRVNPSDVRSADQRTLLAKLVLSNQASGRVSAFKAEVVNASISRPVASNGNLFFPEPHTYYCVRGEIKNPLFPLNQHFYVEIKIVERASGNRRYLTSGSRTIACHLGDAEPFPELEQLSRFR